MRKHIFFILFLFIQISSMEMQKFPIEINNSNESNKEEDSLLKKNYDEDLEAFVKESLRQDRVRCVKETGKCCCWLCGMYTGFIAGCSILTISMALGIHFYIKLKGEKWTYEE